MKYQYNKEHIERIHELMKPKFTVGTKVKIASGHILEKHTGVIVDYTWVGGGNRYVYGVMLEKTNPPRFGFFEPALEEVEMTLFEQAEREIKIKEYENRPEPPPLPYKDRNLSPEEFVDAMYEYYKAEVIREGHPYRELLPPRWVDDYNYRIVTDHIKPEAESTDDYITEDETTTDADDIWDMPIFGDDDYITEGMKNYACNDWKTITTDWKQKVGAVSIKQDVPIQAGPNSKLRSIIPAGSKIGNVYEFAGPNTSVPVNTDGLITWAKKQGYDTEIKDWVHAAGQGYVLVNNKPEPAEIHWFECIKTGTNLGVLGIKAKRYHNPDIQKLSTTQLGKLLPK